MKKFLEHAEKILSIDTTAEKGNEQLTGFVSILMQNRGMVVTSYPVIHSIDGLSKRQFNLIGTLGNPLADKKIKKGLVLLTHLDTNQPGLVEQWTETGGNPFKPVIKDNKIFGLGSVDAKLDFLCKLYAIQKYRERQLKIPLYLIGTCGEKNRMIGTKFLVQSQLINPQYVVIGKPTSLHLVKGHKSRHIFKLTIGYHAVQKGSKGFNRWIRFFCYAKTQNSAFANVGVSAISGMIQFLQMAQEAGFDFKFTKITGGDSADQVSDWANTEFFLISHQLEDFRRLYNDFVAENTNSIKYKMDFGGLGDSGICFLPDDLFECVQTALIGVTNLIKDFKDGYDERFDPKEATVNFGKINHDQQKTELIFDIRCRSGVTQGKLLELLNQKVTEISARFSGLNLKLEEQGSLAGIEIGRESEINGISEGVLKDLGWTSKGTYQSFCSEAGFFTEKNYDVAVIGPGRFKENAYGPNEYCEIPELEKAIQFYEKLIEKVCL